ncbi:hypothetical protein ACET8O_20235 [Aeromonas veronii]
MAIHRVYITHRAKQYVRAAKAHMAAMIQDKGYTPPELSNVTRIPLSNLNRWLDPELETFMPLSAAFVIAQHLGISPRDVLPPDEIGGMSQERYAALEIFLTAPVPHVALMAETYRKMVRVMRE